MISIRPYYYEEFTLMDADKAYNGKFNLVAFLFAPLWALSKGLWVAALAVILISFVTVGLGIVLGALWLGIRGNHMYYIYLRTGRQALY